MREMIGKAEPKPDYIIILPAICTLILGFSYLTYGIFPGPEFLFLCFFLYAAYNKWSRRFVAGWVPFVASFLSYDAINEFLGNLSRFVHVQEPISAEVQMLGTVPTLLLQQFYRSSVLDYLGYFVYSLHFIIPTVFAFILWKYRRQEYWKYGLAFAICTYTALVTFLIYPVAPPWFGVGATRILFQVDSNLGLHLYKTISDVIQPNLFAAFPSLHSAYPWLVSLCAIKIWKRKALPVLLFPILVWFSAVYLGEHYVVDIIGGIAYATFAFLLAEKLIPLLTRQIRK